MVFPNGGPLPRHPSQLYEAALEGVALFLILRILAKFSAVRKRPGVISAAFLGLYGLARFAVEFFREPDAQVGFLPLGATMGQALTLPLAAASALMLWRFARKVPLARTFITSPLLNDCKFAQARFFTRNGGVSEGPFSSANCRFETSDPIENVRENRRRLLATFGIDAKKSLITLHQNHTAKIVVITSPPRSPDEYLAIEADGIITNQPGLAVGVLTADCVPALIADEKTGLVAAIHCGWKGIRRGIIGEAVAKLAALGAKPEDLCVALGPCLKQCSYEVGPEFVEEIGLPEFFRRHGKKYLFDCTAYAKSKFREAGARRVEVLGFDTYVDKDLFFSYRRSVQTGDFAESEIDEGRQLSVIAIK
jgi:YfiH family protein